jgi:hypothetical protein
MTSYNSNCILGEPVPVKEITLPAGFTYLPILSQEPVSASDLFDNAPLVFAMNLYNGDIYWPAGGLFSLTTLYPGIAYMIRLTDQYTFVFPDGKNVTSLKRMPLKSFTNPTNVWETPANTGVVHIYSIAPEALSDFSTNDVIGAFTPGGKCVGMSQISNLNENLALVVYGDDKTTPEKDGLIEGELIMFKVFKGNNLVKEIYPVFDQTIPYNNGRFAENGYSGITNFKEGSTAIEVSEIAGLEIYPNPAEGLLHVNCPVQDGVTEITISSIHGQQLLKSQLSSALTTFDISQFESGIYLIKIRNNDKMIVKQMIKK